MKNSWKTHQNTKGIVLIQIKLSISFLSAIKISSGNLFATLPKLHKNFKISFDIKPLGTVKGLTSIFRIGLGKNRSGYGARNPSLIFHSDSTIMKICGAISGNSNRCFGAGPIPLNQSTTMLIQQEEAKVFSVYFFETYLYEYRYDSSTDKSAIIFSFKYYSSTLVRAISKISLILSFSIELKKISPITKDFWGVVKNLLII